MLLHEAHDYVLNLYALQVELPLKELCVEKLLNIHRRRAARYGIWGAS